MTSFIEGLHEADHLLPFVHTLRENVRQLSLTCWITYLSNKIYSQNNFYYFELTASYHTLNTSNHRLVYTEGINIPVARIHLNTGQFLSAIGMVGK